MSGEDELRRRLQELPGPAGRIDVDAVVEQARKRRRPKVAAVTAAVTGAGVLIVAPFVVPGLSPMSPSSTVMSDQGAGQEAAPEQESSGDSSAAGAAQAAEACALEGAESALGVDVSFEDDPADGIADVAFAFLEDASFQVDGVGVAIVERGTGAIVEAPDPADAAVEAVRGSARLGGVEGEGGGTDASVLLGVRLVLAGTVGCGGGSSGEAGPAPVVWLTDADGVQRVVVGDPYRMG